MFMELPLDAKAAEQAFRAADNIAYAFGKGSHDPAKTLQRIRVGINAAPLAAILIDEVITGNELVTPAELQPHIAAAASFLPYGVRNSVQRINQDDLASSMALGAARGALRSQTAKSQAAWYLGKAKPFINLLTSSERGPRGQLEYEVETVLSTIQHRAQQNATMRRQEEGHSRTFDSQYPGRYVRREDIAATLPSIIKALLEGQESLPFMSGVAAEALSHTTLTKSKISASLSPQALQAITYTLVSSLNAVLPPERRYDGLEGAARQFSKEEFFGSIFSQKFNALQTSLPNLLRAVHALLPEYNEQLRLPYERLRRAFVGPLGHTAIKNNTTNWWER